MHNLSVLGKESPSSASVFTHLPFSTCQGPQWYIDMYNRNRKTTLLERKRFFLIKKKQKAKSVPHKQTHHWNALSRVSLDRLIHCKLPPGTLIKCIESSALLSSSLGSMMIARRSAFYTRKKEHALKKKIATHQELVKAIIFSFNLSPSPLLCSFNAYLFLIKAYARAQSDVHLTDAKNEGEQYHRQNNERRDLKPQRVPSFFTQVAQIDIHRRDLVLDKLVLIQKMLFNALNVGVNWCPYGHGAERKDAGAAAQGCVKNRIGKKAS